eukprot:GHVS01080607.1.p1 GENE.GHVS01080607.1~~GHVS01080607.1.p1  ORF type:complete len:360 (+),score=33.10 GHVS01080607.1:159-1238(+)
MGFVRVICPFVIAATLLLLLPMVTVTSEAIKVGNTDISFVSRSPYPKLFVKNPAVGRVLDNTTMNQRILMFSLGTEDFRLLFEVATMDPQDAHNFATTLKTLLMVYPDSSVEKKPVPVVWIHDNSFYINEALVRYAGTAGQASNVMRDLYRILKVLPNVELQWKNINGHIINMLLARHYGEQKPYANLMITKKFSVRCEDPVKAERLFRVMLQTEETLRPSLYEDETMVTSFTNLSVAGQGAVPKSNNPDALPALLSPMYQLAAEATNPIAAAGGMKSHTHKTEEQASVPVKSPTSAQAKVAAAVPTAAGQTEVQQAAGTQNVQHGAQAIAPSTSAPAQPLATNKKRQRRKKGKGGRQR